MTDNFDGDPRIVIGKNGADIVYQDGQPDMDAGLENNDIIALFTAPGWPGNVLLDEGQHVGSDFEKLAAGSITLSKLADIENAARRAVASPVANTDSVEVSVTNPAGTSLSVLVKRSPPGQDVGQLLVTRDGLNWVNQAEEVDVLPMPALLSPPPVNLISSDTTAGRIYIHDGVSNTVSSSFLSPSSIPTGLTFDGTNLISADTNLNIIYIHDGVSSAILSSFSAPGASPHGLAYDGTNLISSDGSTGRIYIHDGISSTILSSFLSPSSTPTGLAFDGANLISADAFSDTIYIHDGISSTILSSFSAPGISPQGLAYDGVNLISVDTAADTIYVHKGATGVIPRSFSSPGVAPQGITTVPI